MNKYNKSKLGLCETSGLIKVDYAADHEIGVDNTVVHEFIHNQFFNTSYYGIFLGLLDNITTIDKQYLKTVELLEYYMTKPQESIATFFEYISYYKFHGKEEFLIKLSDLKSNNKKYYDYLDMLLFLINEERIDIDTKSNLVMYLGFSVFAIDLTDINIELMKNHNKLEKFIINQNNSPKYLPITRFRLLLKDLKKYLTETKEINTNDINNIILYNDKVPVFESKDKSVNNIMDYMRNLSNDSKYNSQITKLLSSAKQADDYMALTGVSIQSLNEYNTKTILYNDYIKLNSDIPIVAFIAMYIVQEDLVKALSNPATININEYNKFTVKFVNYEKQENYTIKDLSFDKFIHDNKSIKTLELTTYIFFEEYIKDLFRNSEQNLYVISSLPYDYISMYFKAFISNTYKYRIIDFDHFSVIVLSITEKIKVLIPIETLAGIKFYEDLSTKKCKFDLISTTDEEPYDTYIYRNNNDLFLYELIINSYLQTERL